MYLSQFRWLGSLFLCCFFGKFNQTIGSTEVNLHSKKGNPAEDRRFNRKSRKQMFVVDFQLPIQLYETEFFS